MHVIETIEDLRKKRASLPPPIGFVPTMGFLHEGHLSLVHRAKAECASVVVSIFVNPTQFGPQEDLEAYPRDLPRDLAMLEKAGVDIVWTPTVETMYPQDFQTWVEVEQLSRPLEGAMRPGHFRGVTTIVCKLFNAVQPQKAYFGQKDAQQARLIQQMVRDLNFDIEIVICPIVREADGLAMSSRNTYLNPEERQAATVLSHALQQAHDAFVKGERNAEKLRAIVEQTIHAQPLARLQYVSCAFPETLEEMHGEIQGTALLSLAAFVGRTRLIDNLILDARAQELQVQHATDH